MRSSNRAGWADYLAGKSPGKTKPKKKRGDPEHQEQKAVFEWAQALEGQHPELELLHAIPNGGGRPSKQRYDKKTGRMVRYSVEAAKLKAEGVKPGVPDVMLPVARQGFHGLYIEMKADRGRTSKDQRRWIDRLRAEGYRVEVAVGWVAAARILAEYLGIRGQLQFLE